MRMRRSDMDAQAGAVGRLLDAVDEADAGARVVTEQQVAVEIDVVAERSDATAGSDAEPGFDHAPDHHLEPQRPGGVRHPDRLADASRLGELDVDAVGDAGTPVDVGKRVAIL